MRNIYPRLCLIVLLMVTNQLIARTYYVSPNGLSSNNGDSFTTPMDLKTALSKVVAGDLVLCANGTYKISYIADQKNTILLSKSGSATKPITVMTENGDKATIDFSFPIGAWVQDSFGFEITGSYWYFKNIQITRAGYQGVYVKGGYNTFENCVFYENRNTGLEINKGGHHTTVVNCDAYRNYDPKKSGSMADGFGPKQTQGPGNKFIGCRAWENSDDGYDCFDSPEIVTFENCWAFRNGIDVWNYGGFSGNGNGFKVGGNDALANNRLTNCVAFGQPKKGFDQNNNTGGLTILNCTAYDNGDNYGLGGTLVSGEKHTIRNNISLSSSQTVSNANQSNNTWNSGFSVSTSDFVSLQTSLATIARNADGTIPATDLFRLKPTSKLVDAGSDVGLPYEGSAPDLGAFEVKVNTNLDCYGVENGIASLDACGVCVGGTSPYKSCTGNLEAETACEHDGVLDENTNSGFSGTGYVNTTNAEGAYATWALTSDKAQMATVSFRYANGGTTSRDGAITLNGTAVGNLVLPSTGAWTTWEVVSVNLNVIQGQNTLKVTATSADGLANIDLLSFSSGVTDGGCLVTRLENDLAPALEIYPNPTSSKVSWQAQHHWVLIDALGEQLASGLGNEIDLSNYHTGLYVVKVGEKIQRVVKE